MNNMNKLYLNGKVQINKLLLCLIGMKPQIILGNKSPFLIKCFLYKYEIFSDELWNLVVDSLLDYTKNRIPCDIQGFADDLSLTATLESPSSNGKGGFDADTLREITLKTLNSIDEWCKENCEKRMV